MCVATCSTLELSTLAGGGAVKGYTGDALGSVHLFPGPYGACQMPEGAGAPTEEPVFRPKRQHALGRPAPPPAHSTDNVCYWGNSLRSRLSNSSFAPEGRKNVHKGVLFFDVSHTQVMTAISPLDGIYTHQSVCGKAIDSCPLCEATQRVRLPHSARARR